MNIGIIGAGYMGSMHANIIKGLTCGTLVGIAAKTPGRSGEVAERLGIRRYSSYRELIDDPGVDVVDICTPTGTHAEIACESLAAGKHVIVEFPICSTSRELARMRRASGRAGRVCAAAYYSRFQSQYKYVFDFARSGRLGKITGLYISRRSSPAFASGDIVNNLISQDIDLMVTLLGKPRRHTGARVGEDACSLVFQYDGAVAVIEGATNMPQDFPFTTRHRLTGEDGCIELDWRFTDRPESRILLTSKGGTETLVASDYDPYAFELERIISGIGKGDTAEFDIDSVYESARLSFECRDW